MPIDPSALYREGFDARCAAACGDGAKRVSGEGLQGVITQGVDPDLQLLVEDDRAQGPLQDLLPVPATGTVRVLAAAARCEQLVAGDPRWTDNGPALAMVHPDLRALPEVSLPAGLRVVPVHRGDATGEGIPLRATLDLVRRATGRANPGLTSHLEGLPEDVTLLAAVDEQGEVRATGGSRTFGPFAYVFFVNTDPSWQRRGIGLAMTSLALVAARGRGADAACLDASEAGASIYRRLGFVEAGVLTQHHPHG